MGLLADLDEHGMYRSYERYVLRMEPILKAASVRGMPIDRERHHELSMEMKRRMDRIYEGMQQLVPTDARSLSKHKVPRVLSFTPSQQQLVRYMRFKGHPVPKDWKSDKVTTREKELLRLARSTKDDLYQLVHDYRDAQTMLKNHLKNWTPKADGRVHPIFYNTATGQMEARRPNVMNAPNHKESQKGFRGIVVASPGHTILELDYSGFHALYLAWESGDKAMERLTRMDIHSYLTAHFLRLPDADRALGWDDEKLRAWLATIKRDYKAVRNAKVKHALLGYNNGMGWRKLFNQYREFFDKMEEAKRIMGLLDSLFPEAARFRARMRQEAHEKGFIQSRFGCVRFFWEVYKYQGGKWSHGVDAEAAISFIQQNHAHCHLKDVMLQLEDEGWLERARFMTPEHDSLKFECPLELLEEAKVHIREVMEAPNPTSGLAVGTEMKVGRSWGEMEVVR